MCWNKIKLLFMYVSLIYLGGATIYTRYKMSTLSADFGGLLAIFCVLLLLLFSIKKKKPFTGISVIFVLFATWTVLQSIKWGQVEVYWSFVWDFFAAYIICVAYKKEIFIYYEHCVMRLSWVAIVLWIISWILPFFPAFLKAISPNWIFALEESNILIFGLQPADLGGAIFFRRNCGFAWEPGRFASIVVVAIFINIVRMNFRIKGNRNLFVLLVALATTQSTTGFGAFFIVVFTFLYNVKKKYFLPFFIISAILFICTLFLPFMGGKISALWIDEQHNKEFEKKVTYWIDKEDKAIVPQRFDGILWELYNVSYDPMLGYGKEIKRSYTGRLFNGNLVLYNGTIKIFAVFGIFYGLLFYVFLFYGSKYVSSLFQYKGSFFFLLLFICINISYPFHFEPLFLAMFGIPTYYLKKNEKNNNIISIY